jgi:hypothetical protein
MSPACGTIATRSSPAATRILAISFAFPGRRTKAGPAPDILFECGHIGCNRNQIIRTDNGRAFLFEGRLDQDLILTRQPVRSRMKRPAL